MNLEQMIEAVTNTWIKYAAYDGGHGSRIRLLKNFVDIEGSLGASEYKAHILMSVLLDLVDLSDLDVTETLRIQAQARELDLSEFEDKTYGDGFENGMDKQLKEDADV